MDKYTKKYLKMLKEAKTNKEKEEIIEKIYEDGYTDGVSSQ